MKYKVLYKKSLRNSSFRPSTPISQKDYKKIGVVEADNLEDLFCKMNVVNGDELPVKMKIRSMSVGDIAVDEMGQAHYCDSVGWRLVVKMKGL